MQKNYGFGYAEYERNLDKRIDIEQERQKEYEKSLEVSNEMERKIL